MKNPEIVEIETHTGKVKILLKDVWEMWYIPNDFNRNDKKFTHTLRVFDRSRKYLHHIYGITKETAEMLKKKTGVPVWNEYSKSKTHEQDEEMVKKHFEKEDRAKKFMELMVKKDG